MLGRSHIAANLATLTIVGSVAYKCQGSALSLELSDVANAEGVQAGIADWFGGLIANATDNQAAMANNAFNQSAVFDTIGSALQSLFGSICSDIWNMISFPFLSDIGFMSFVLCALGLAMFIAASTLPDIDQKLPIAHRGWTHTIWVCLALLAATVVFFNLGTVSIWFAYFGYIMAAATAGYTGHIFWDMFSRGGIAWAYPLTGYITYGSGAKIKRGHFLWLYRTGKTSETVVVVVLIVLAVLSACFAVVA